MKADATSLLNLIRKADQFMVPMYQRKYSWTKFQCQRLWDDIIRSSKSEKIDSHFVGSIVYIEAGQYQVTGFSPQLLIDGQQRLTTTMLLLAALTNITEDSKIATIDDINPEKIRNYYLLNPQEEDQQHYKLLLTDTDAQSLQSIIKNTNVPQEKSNNIYDNYNFFVEKLEEYRNRLREIIQGINKLHVVDISLDRNHDNPQLIFESMNSTGLALTQSDLIRNFVLMDLEPKKLQKIYNKYWREMELKFGQEDYSSDFDKFVRHYLTLKKNNIPKISRVYEEFKIFSKEFEGNIEYLVSDLKDFASYYCNIVLNKEQDRDLKEAFQNIKELKAETTYPFLLKLYSDYDAGNINKNELLQIVQIVESYVFRRTICEMPANTLIV